MKLPPELEDKYFQLIHTNDTVPAQWYVITSSNEIELPSPRPVFYANSPENCLNNLAHYIRTGSFTRI